MPSRVDALALDLDGTLLDPGEAISAEARGALADAAAQGVQIFVVTGRPAADILRILGATGLLAGPYPQAFIAEERDIHERAGAGFAGRQPRNRELLAREHGLSRALWAELQDWQAELGALDAGFDWWGEEQVQRRGFIELHFRSAALAAEAAVLLQARTAGRAQAVRNGRLVALRLPGTGKGPALAELAAGRGLQPGRVLAIGDSENDRSMLDGALGFAAAAPANADPAIRALVAARGGLVTAAERSRGVAEAIRGALGGRQAG